MSSYEVITWAQKGDYDRIEQFLRAGGDVNVSAKGCSLLEGDFNLDNLLHRALTNIDENATALTTAAARGYHRIVELLLVGGADINAVQENGHTALSLAVSRGHGLVVEMLLAGGANVMCGKRGGGGKQFAASYAKDDNLRRMVLGAPLLLSAVGMWLQSEDFPAGNTIRICQHLEAHGCGCSSFGVLRNQQEEDMKALLATVPPSPQLAASKSSLPAWLTTAASTGGRGGDGAPTVTATALAAAASSSGEGGGQLQPALQRAFLAVWARRFGSDGSDLGNTGSTDTDLFHLNRTMSSECSLEETAAPDEGVGGGGGGGRGGGGGGGGGVGRWGFAGRWRADLKEGGEGEGEGECHFSLPMSNLFGTRQPLGQMSLTQTNRQQTEAIFSSSSVEGPTLGGTAFEKQKRRNFRRSFGD